MRKNLFTTLHTVVANCKCKSEWQRTKPNLAVTPGQMFEMAAHGVPISLQNAANFTDGEVNPSWDVPAEKVRGIDMADLWNLEQSSREKLKKGIKEAKAAKAQAEAESNS